jgi:hypothetical protein
MSMEMHVFFRGALPTKAALTRAMKDLGFPFTIRPATGSLEQQKGFMPMRFRREDTGVEFDVFEGRATVEELAGKNVDGDFDRSANFRWGGDETEMLAGMCAAAALAKLVNGVVFDDEEGLLLRLDEAVAFAKKHLDTSVKPAESGTRPADIKRYLKSLLKLRSDLVLVGRYLLIRPVRHIMRGARLDASGDKHAFNVWRFFVPLYDPAWPNGCGDRLRGDWDVRQPHFERYLLDSLAEEIFEPLGRMTTLDDLAAVLDEPNRIFAEDFCAQGVRALVLSGQRERAAEYIRELEERRPRVFAGDWAQKRRDFLARDIHEVCAMYHAREAQHAQDYKIAHIWEPMPFPVELPVAKRASESSDPLFVATPWVTHPPWVLQELPEEAGEVRFAEEWISPGGRKHMPDGPALLVPLSREEADSRHRKNEP